MVTRVYLSRTDEMLGSKVSNAPGMTVSLTHLKFKRERKEDYVREGEKVGIVLQDS